ncbi:ATP-binding protein [Deferrisoma camini]|uniref:ATP-binding protein n=1 Tax=Deferrisoma camini TaxID=1035120 RepID=UPI00046D1B53|nr:ATP-binding protein [Deferrisoma camini]
MVRFRDLPLGRKVGLAVVAASTISLALAVGLFAWREVRSYRDHASDRLRTLAEVLAANCAAPLLFDDPDAAARTLASLSSQPQVRAAWLLDRHGEVFARYGRAERPPPRGANGDGVWWAERSLAVGRTVSFEGEPLGRIVIQVDTAELHARLWWGLGVAGAVMGVAVLVAWLVSIPLRRRISGPIQALAAAMDRVASSGDYSVRIPGGGRDEVGTLIRGFNRMLAQIAERDEKLARLAAAVDQAVEGIAVTDPEGRVLYGNRAFRRLCGVDEPVEGVSLFELYPADEPRVQELREAAERGQVWSGRIRARRADGSAYYEECALSPVMGERGEVRNLVVVKRDVTREVEFENRLAQNQRLEALGTLAGGVAHDFNNILTPILGYADMALQEVEPGSHLEKNLRRVVRAAERARGIVQQILAFSRQGEEGRTPLRLGTLLEETEGLLRASIPKHVRLEVRSETSSDWVVGDATQLQQVLMNLATNAWHAMEPDGGTLEMVLEEHWVSAGDPELPTGRYLRIRVTDEGCGMPAEVLDRIFEPFFTTKEVGKGTGLGLAAVHGIVQAHGGTVRVESRPGEGTTFRVYLPAKEGPEPASPSRKKEPRRQVPPRGQGERILVVDDELEVADFLSQTLEALGYEVEAVVSPAEARSRLERNARGYDLLLTDQTMPECTGLALARWAHGVRPDLPVVLCTGYSAAVTPRALAEAGVAVVVPKPVSPSQLAAEVRRVLGDDA